MSYRPEQTRYYFVLNNLGAGKATHFGSAAIDLQDDPSIYMHATSKVPGD
jgi:hypothetical protein